MKINWKSVFVNILIVCVAVWICKKLKMFDIDPYDLDYDYENYFNHPYGYTQAIPCQGHQQQ